MGSRFVINVTIFPFCPLDTGTVTHWGASKFIFLPDSLNIIASSCFLNYGIYLICDVIFMIHLVICDFFNKERITFHEFSLESLQYEN